MEATLAVFLYCMALLSTAVPEDCHRENQTELVQDCITSCSFSTLERAMYEEENHLNIWNAFHHPREALPQYLVVNYSTNTTSHHEFYNNKEYNNTIYLWTSNSIYFVVPPHMFAFISLFLGMLDDDHTGEVTLTLPENCSCWLNGCLYFTDSKNSTMNYLEILTEKLRGIGNVSSYPQSVSNYQYQSSAVREDKLRRVYHECNNPKYDIRCLCGDIFFSFIFVLPFVAMIIYAIVILSEHKAIKKMMKKPKNHQNFAALISLGLTIGWYVTILDSIAVFWTKPKEEIHIIYYSMENNEYKKLRNILGISLMVELAICCLGEIWFWIATFRQWKNSKYNNCCDHTIISCWDCRWKCNNSETDVEARDCCDYSCRWQCYENKEIFCADTVWEDDKRWWALLLLFIPPIWCLVSHFGFILIAWSSFVRHSKSLTLFYIFAITVMFLVMRQTYTLIVNIYYWAYLEDGTNKDEKQENDGISVWVIQLVRVVGVLLVGFFIYLILGLWFLPVTETVEEVPVYLYDFLELIIIVLALLMSYHLISFRDNHQNGNGGYRPI